MGFRERDVAEDPVAAEEMVRLTGQRGVPVVVIDGRVVVGFDRRRLDELLAEPRRPHLGAAVADVTQMAAEGRTFPSSGAYVGRVTPGSPAARAGLRVGDVIVSLANHSVDSALDLESLMARVPVGSSIPLAYYREGTRQVVSVRF